MSDWEVFARSELDAPIRHVGTVAADRPEDAEVFAWKLYDEWSWKEMFVVRREDIVRLIPGAHPEQTSATACLIFGRTDAGPLLFQGRLESGDAAVRSGSHWVELALMPESSPRWVLGPVAGPVPR
jgi:hypothetical protein